MASKPTIPAAPAIVWFRRTLRLDDHRALRAALDTHAVVVCVFVLDSPLLAQPSTGAPRMRFLLESLAELDDSLRARGGRLVVRHGVPAEELARLAHETQADSLYFSRDYVPYSRKRDDDVERAMRELGVAVHTENDNLISEPSEVLTREGHPYTVFTPYRRTWLAQLPADEPVDTPESVPGVEGLHSVSLKQTPAALGVGGDLEAEPFVRGGESEARAHLARFLHDAVADYAVRRDVLGAPGTSRLSAYLKFGAISPRRILHGLRRHLTGVGAETFLSELCWRDFYYQILFHFPHVAEGAFRPAYNAIQWDNNEEWFRAWQEGRTGYPIVDAAQRQLERCGWMHNRARMITASFLTKDLHIDWRWGERHFMQKLIDGDQPSNNGGWQWSAGTGTDAQPFFRIFNPVSQGEKFDADGVYVRRYVPELARVPNKFIHRPWELRTLEQQAIGCVIGRDYPSPIVDHAIQREQALALYRSAASEVKGVGH